MLWIEWVEAVNVFQPVPPVQVASRPSRLPTTQNLACVHEMVCPGTPAANTSLDEVSWLPSQNHTVPPWVMAAQKELVTQEMPLIAAVCDGVVTGADHEEPLKATKSPPALPARQ